MDDETNIVLIGFMGSGKTSVGTKLARIIDYEFMDTDFVIEQNYGTSISHIFSEKGEDAFRDMETQLLMRIAKTIRKTVIATGGGLPLRKINSDLLKKAGHVIFLKSSVETTLSRLKDDTSRPLLSGDNVSEKIECMINERLPIYQAVADDIVETDNFSFYEIIKEIEIIIDSLK